MRIFSDLQIYFFNVIFNLIILVRMGVIRMFGGIGKTFWGLRVSSFYKFKSRKQGVSQVSLLYTTAVLVGA